MPRSGSLLFIAATACAALGLGVAIGTYTASFTAEAPPFNGIYLDEPRPLEPFTLLDDEGQPLTLEGWTGQWDFLYFGYTFCPDVCPLTLLELAKVKTALDQVGLDRESQFWLVSVDPQRDTPERLKAYTRYFDPEFRGATGERGALDHLTQQLGVVYQINDPEPGKDYYLVDHSSTVILIDPQGRLQALWTPPHKPEDISADFQRIVAQAG